METPRVSPLIKSPCPASFQMTGVDAWTASAAGNITTAMHSTRHPGTLLKYRSYRFTVSRLQFCPATT